MELNLNKASGEWVRKASARVAASRRGGRAEGGMRMRDKQWRERKTGPPASFVRRTLRRTVRRTKLLVDLTVWCDEDRESRLLPTGNVPAGPLI